ncbi:(2E,6E)-farnesyl diphosphate synthase [Providencia vermicola]|uniref:(2E,6E)-farnesyl diphosphate synthase n=2 Tax=Providencia TaxID=586 RepID=A0AAI9I446_PROST|nr:MULTISPECIES: (2E,6E)-farnesyl diphosphate synthase [Providencia]ELR5043920.1 (2E,6E)-farnesyl diphosphate synthase [Providencia rettgeri]ELR5037312.1 (2E,6E)-farnesyl diphosphate synthase [Providencia stuartii]ELR5292508.1 (2E,6E)-farnesyl diphosphate synthase [Providencia stuartii]ELX8379251.1 (2E,6E)-farnesyl diphosphate synthase [Providencia stuartii]ELZ5939484.1 (2E,6E)-farnesyl diphosphate synthase [Providencia stuartii]
MSEQHLNSFIVQQQQAYERVNQYLLDALDALPFSHLPLAAAMKHGALLGGKRLRPFLTYTVGSMLGVAAINLDAPAAAVECIHAYSLIHDDLPAMDDDDLRRGQPTCHIKFGEGNAILAGDALQTLAFQLLSSAPMPDVTDKDRIAMLSELAYASGLAGMCGGQALDLEAEGKRVGLAELEQIHQHKTGALIRAAIRMGAYAAGDNGYQILSALDHYAEAIGLAFQVQDDILDVIGDSEITGKRQGADAEHEKSTYPSLLGLEAAQEKARELYFNALEALKVIEAQGYNTQTLIALANFIIERKS